MSGRPGSGWWAAIAAIVCGGFLAGCSFGLPKDLKPVPRQLVAAMHDLGMEESSPIFIRIFKEESQLEVWKQTQSGQYALLKIYEICSWSGELGPKKVQGDKQAPEGFYTVTPAQMNPDSQYYLSFNIGYPNAYDQSLGRTGANLMVHGACSSAGCYSMTDASAGELFALARDAFKGGQREFQIQAFPFRMTPENMARHHDNPNLDFWRMLKVGYDSFELTHVPPKVDVCDFKYVFDADAGAAPFDPRRRCPAYSVREPLRTALAKKQASDDARYRTLVAGLRSGGSPAPLVAEAAPPPPPAAGPIRSIIGTLVNRDAAPAPAPVSTASTPPSAPPTAAAQVAAAPATPIPPPKPALTPVAATASAGPATPVPTVPKPVTVTSAPGSDPIGTMINRKFWWDDAPPPPRPGGA
jgi:murein L,D-transpeptidase YafK